MIISSIRLGFANNSSSNHSILLVPNASKLLDSNVSEFGQHSFTLCTPDSKTKYFIAQLMGELSATLHNYEICKNIITDITGITFDETGYVDHQSTWDFPRNFDGKSYNIDFIKDFQEFILKDDVIIEGDDSNTRYTGKFEYPFKEEGGELIVKRAKKDKYTLFNRSNGTKVRLNFDLNSQGKPITEFASTPTPELIDIKITDYCPYNCFFCYQDSTKEGKHASLEEIKNLVKDLRELEVFEVALGGGEPTLHPDFIEILSLFHENQIVPNFTTFNMAWTKNQELAEAITYFCKSFAISTLDIQNLEMLKEWNSQWTWNDKGPKGTLQIPLGVYPKHKMEEALKYCVGNSIPITLLGFKKFGRGTEINPADSEWIFSFIKEHNKFRPFSFGGDTLFVNQFRDQLKKLHVHEVLMVGEEGKFSMYIDAVEKTIGPSSYVDERYPYSSLKEDILSRFPFNE